MPELSDWTKRLIPPLFLFASDSGMARFWDCWEMSLTFPQNPWFSSLLLSWELPCPWSSTLSPGGRGIHDLGTVPSPFDLKPFLPWKSSFCRTPTGDFSSLKYSAYNPLPVTDLRSYSNILIHLFRALSVVPVYHHPLPGLTLRHRVYLFYCLLCLLLLNSFLLPRC